MDVEIAIYSTITKLGYSYSLMVIREFINRGDVFVIFPTSFGKTLCFTCLPMVFDELYLYSKPSIIVVVTPLIAMQDQV